MNENTLVVWIRLEDTSQGVRPVAFFPSLPGDMDPATMLSYSTIGQHGAASEEYLLEATKECEGTLKVGKRMNHGPLRGVTYLVGVGGKTPFLQETATLQERITFLCEELRSIYEKGEDRCTLLITYPSNKFLVETLPIAKLLREMGLRVNE